MEDAPSPVSQLASHKEREQSDARLRIGQPLLNTGNNDREAFRLLYALTCNKLFGICLRICQDRSAAEDILAEVYLTIWKRAGAWEPARGSAISWLATIARNRAIDWRRGRTAWQIDKIGDGPDFVDGSPDSESVLLSAERDSVVHRCLAALVPHQQTAIRAVFFEGLQYSELSARARVPVPTMKSRVRQGLAIMKTELARDEDGIMEPFDVRSSRKRRDAKPLIAMECSA